MQSLKNFLIFTLLFYPLITPSFADNSMSIHQFHPTGLKKSNILFKNVEFSGLSPQISTASKLVVIQSSFHPLTKIEDAAFITKLVLSFGSLQNQLPVFTAKPALESRILAYPNPMKFSSGEGEITYRLNRPVDIDVYVYNMRGQMIYKDFFPKNTTGATYGYNSIEFTASKVGSYLPSSVYFIVILHKGEVLGKGKLVVVP